LPALPAKFLLSSVLVTELPEPEDVEVGGLGGWGTAVCTMSAADPQLPELEDEDMLEHL